MTGFWDAMLVPFTNEGLFLELVWLFGLYLILAVALDLILGYAGMFQLGQIGFFALGAVGTTVGTHPDFLGLDMFAGILLGLAMATVATLVIGLPTLRLRGDYFAIATLGFGLATQVVLAGFWIQGVFNVPTMNPFGCDLSCMTDTGWGHTVGGAVAFVFGIDEIPNPVRRGLELALLWAIAITVYVAVGRMKHAPFGRLLKAVREDPRAAEAMGKDVNMLRFKAFWVSGLLSALAGSLFVHHQTALVPTAYGFQFTILVLVMVILGGMGNHAGALLGALLVTAVNQFSLSLTTWLDEAAPRAADTLDLPSLRLMLFAALLLAMMIVRPQGILGDRAVSIRSLYARVAGHRSNGTMAASSSSSTAAPGGHRGRGGRKTGDDDRGEGSAADQDDVQNDDRRDDGEVGR